MAMGSPVLQATILAVAEHKPMAVSALISVHPTRMRMVSLVSAEPAGTTALSAVQVVVAGMAEEAAPSSVAAEDRATQFLRPAVLSTPKA